MGRLRALFLALPWHQLQPEENHAVITGGYGKDVTTAITARAPDRKLSVTYIPSTGIDRRELTVDAGQFSGSISPRWFNPSTGHFSQVDGTPLANHGFFKISTPGDNGTQANDWGLLLEVH
jgi:hypothetical protein